MKQTYKQCIRVGLVIFFTILLILRVKTIVEVQPLTLLPIQPATDSTHGHLF